jgi:hypothetical protein
VLRRQFGLWRGDVIVGWTKLYNGDLHNLYFLLNIIKMIKSSKMSLAGYVARMERKINTYRSFGKNLGGKRPPGRPRC